jgi:heptosyltransferase-3
VEILLLHPGGLGDVILSLPAVALLREKLPSARITFAGNTDHLVPVVSKYAEKTVSLAALPLHNLYEEAASPDSDVRFWKSFDQVVSWTGSGDPVFVRKLKTICPTARIGIWRPHANESRHVAQLFIDSLGCELSSGRKAVYAPIYLSPQQLDQGVQWLSEQGWKAGNPLVALHPGAGSKVKRWPLTRFASLARHLARSEGKKLLIVDGPAELGLARQVDRELGEVELILGESLPLGMLASVLSQAELFIGNDSGIAHLAAGLGIPAIVLFGPTLPQHWAPLGPDVRILRNPQKCTGCNSNSNAHTCLGNITVEAVIQALPVGQI